MASSEPQQSPQNNSVSAPEPAQWHGTPAVIHYGALAVAVVGPVGLLLPRQRGAGTLRSFLQTAILYGGSFWAVNQLAIDYSGKSITARTNERLDRLFAPLTNSLPEKAQKTKLLLEAERARRAAALPEEERALYEENRRKKEEQKKTVLSKLWMGNEKDGWQERRIEEDRKKLESGKGYWDLIMDQVSEVWNQGSKDKKEVGQPEAVDDEKSGSGKK